MTRPLPDDIQERVRAIIDQPVAELVAIGLEGGELAACSLLARQYIGRLYLAGDLEALQELRDEIDDDLNAEDDEPPAPFLRVVQ